MEAATAARVGHGRTLSNPPHARRRLWAAIGRPPRHSICRRDSQAARKPTTKGNAKRRPAIAQRARRLRGGRRETRRARPVRSVERGAIAGTRRGNSERPGVAGGRRSGFGLDADVAGGNVAAAGQWAGVSIRIGQSFTAWRMMNAHEYLSDDGQTMLSLCSSLALPPHAAETDLSPLKLSEWNQLARKIAESSLKTPAALQGRDADELAKALAIPADEAERIARLLEFAGQLSVELQNLFEQGLWAVTRVDELYPPHLRDTLKHQAPTVLFGAGEIRLLQRAGVAVVGSRDIAEAGAAFAREVGAKAVAAKRPVVSGGARGTDRISMQAALEADG